MKLSTPEKSEVDKRVAQELKNNQEFIYKTNQALQNLNEGLNALSFSHRREMAGMQSMHKSLEISFENLANDICRKVANCFMGIDEMQRMVQVFKAGVEQDVKLLDKRIPDAPKIEAILEEIVNKQYTLDTSHDELSCHIENCNMLMKGYVKHEIDSVRNDLAPDAELPKKMEERTKELLKTFYVDFEGLVLEIARLRKEIDYNKKQFEQIYTLIQRLRDAQKV